MNEPSSITRAGWLTLNQAASELGISVHSVRRRVRAGQVIARQVLTSRGPAWRVLLARDADDQEYAHDVVDLEAIRQRQAPTTDVDDEPIAREVTLYLPERFISPWRVLAYAASFWLTVRAVSELIAVWQRWGA